MFDREVFQQILSSYKADFLEELWPQERFKWVAVKQFQDHWDANAENFGSMLEKALAETHNLLATVHFYPRSMILRFAHDFPEETRAMFINLFDESKDPIDRIMRFIADANLFEDRYEDRDWGLHYQTANSVSTYLWLCYPDEYYIYKYAEYYEAAKKLNATYIPKAGKNESNIRQHFSLFEEIRDLLMEDKELTQAFSEVKDEACYPDPKGNTLAIDFIYYIRNYYEKNKKEDIRYWWLNSNPNLWSFSYLEYDDTVPYAVVNERGNLRRIHQHFLDAREGDLVIGYETSPTMQIVALARVAKSYDGDYVHFEKLEQLANPIDYSILFDQPELVNMEFLKNPQGSLFRLTPKEYETVMRLIRKTNPDEDEGMDNNEEYSRQHFLDEVFMSEASYDTLVSLLRNKKNVILQGAPGVGKTFAAKRLAYSMIGMKDDSRIEHIQFHQNYTYEDFIMGYKPKGTDFELQNGLFYRFCKKATQNPDQEYYFIVDEINRGNLSKIFGELLMLIEKDYRGIEITLAYNREPFSVPDNLLLIGMMNTADRSLAMIDYALRRRFSFFDMEPAFNSKGFIEYQAGFEDEILDSLIENIKELNRVIAKDDSLGEGFRIGHSYFCDRMGPPDEWMHEVVNYDILPMLKEYWFDDKSRFQHWESKLRSILSD